MFEKAIAVMQKRLTGMVHVAESQSFSKVSLDAKVNYINEIDELSEAIAALQNIKVAAPLPGVGANAPSLTPTASAPDCLVGEPAVVATAANKPQHETVTPFTCSDCIKSWCCFRGCVSKCDIKRTA